LCPDAGNKEKKAKNPSLHTTNRHAKITAQCQRWIFAEVLGI
jgi:hypothetical protein